MQTKVKKATGGFTFEDDRSPLPDSIVQNYENLAYDLSSIYQVKTYEELQEILEANMPSIVEACPDADLTNAVSFETEAVVTKTSVRTNTTSKPAVTTKVNIRLDDEDDVVATSTRSTAKATANLSLDDDFMSEADALLNS
jgi:hypothetical protein